MCKDEVLKEIDKLREDYSAYVAGDVLLLSYDDGADAKGGAAGGATDEDGSPDGCAVSEGAKKSRVHRPRSLLFRAVAEFSPFARSSGNRGPSTSKIDGVDRRRATMPSWKRKKKGNIDDHHGGEARRSARHQAGGRRSRAAGAARRGPSCSRAVTGCMPFVTSTSSCLRGSSSR